MTQARNSVPEGLHTVTPHLVVRNAAQAIEFYKRAFGAEERSRFEMPVGAIGHAELKIGDSVIFLADEMPAPGGSQSPQSVGGSTCTLNIYVDDVDKLFDQAVNAGGKSVMPVADMFWGDRYGTLTDPFGHVWSIATHKEDLSNEEIAERAQEFFAKMPPMQKTA
jgi:PhnB protein